MPNIADAGNLKVEYWLDDDLTGVKSETAGSGSLSLSIDISVLKPGVHYFNCTPISATGERGNSERYLFYVPLSQEQTSVSPIKGYEYWLDDNYAAKTISNSAGRNATLAVSLEGLSSGVHYFNCRAFNERGEYGCPVRKMFYIPQTKVNTNASIASAEYWLDDDYASKVTVTGSNTQQTFSIDISHLGSGVHYFNYRAKDNEGVWGNLTRQMFYIAQKDASSGGRIAEYEYWIDDDVAHKVTGKDSKTEYVFSIDISNLSEGDHTFHFRAKNLLEQWGETFTDLFRIEADVNPEDDVPATVKVIDVTMTYGDPVPQLTYTKEGGDLRGTPELKTTATSTSPVGSYPITANKGTVANQKVTYVNGTLTINKAPLTIKAGTYTKQQGMDNPEFKLTYEGFKNDETAAVLTTQPSVYTSATKDSPLGDYEVIVSGATAQNYDITHVNGTLKVTEADAITIVAKDYTRVYGDANPAFDFTSSGAPLNGTPEITCEATATSPVGTYPIVIKKGSVTNYNDSYVNGTLTITKAPLLIKAGTYTKKQGEENPEFTLSYIGFKNNETASVLTTQPTVTTTAVKNSPVGEYEVVVSGGTAQNYDLNYMNGKLVVTEADAVIIIAKDYTRMYGDANPTFDYSSIGAELSGRPEITCEATASSPVGTYPIVIKKGSVTNFNDTYVNGTLTITKAPLTVSVEDASIVQGENIPTFLLKYSGFRNGDTESTAFTAKPSASTIATSNSLPGTYPIVVSGGSAQNYALTYQPGTLTIILPDGIDSVFDDQSETWYTIDGKKLDGVPNRKGIYIVNGRKVIIK